MTLLQILPPLAYAGVAVFILWIAGGAAVLRWALPAGLAVLFVGFTAVTLVREGLLQFWINHTTNYTGNQVWFDLLFAVGISFYLIAPRARAVGMRLLPWAVALIATACVALLPMLARLLWLESKAALGNTGRG